MGVLGGGRAVRKGENTDDVEDEKKADPNMLIQEVRDRGMSINHFLSLILRHSIFILAASLSEGDVANRDLRRCNAVLQKHLRTEHEVEAARKVGSAFVQRRASFFGVLRAISRTGEARLWIRWMCLSCKRHSTIHAQVTAVTRASVSKRLHYFIVKSRMRP